MQVLIDGDALPNRLKQILLRAIERHRLITIVISNKPIFLGAKSTYINYQVVAEGPDQADDQIVALVQAGDLVITADIPLADRVLSKQARAIDHRGKEFRPDNIKQSLAVRNLLEGMRDRGEMTKGPAPFSAKDAHAFANQLETLLRQRG